MNHKKSVGKRSLAFSRNLGLTISFALHVVLGSGFVALNIETSEEEVFELLESQSILKKSSKDIKNPLTI